MTGAGVTSASVTDPHGTAASRSGLLVVDKPAGVTSHDVVARVRRLAGTRKVGHAGTLDPMATGVLLLGVNRGTRLLGHLTLADKSYDATARLGVATTTDDADGEPVAVTDASQVDEAAVRAAVTAFLGDINQVPSSVSAIKVAGRRSYARVRAGEDVELPARRVTVHRLEVRGVRQVGGHLDVDLTVRCSSGTYVRALARDVGAALRVGGHLTALRRTSVGPVDLAEATPLAALESAVEERRGLPLMSMEDAVGRFFPTFLLDAEHARDVSHGRPLDVGLPAGVVAMLAPDGRFVALYERTADGPARPVAVFA